MSLGRESFRWLKRLPAYRYLAIPRRAVFGAGYLLRPLPAYLRWIVSSREESNFTYDLTDENLLYLSHFLSVVTGREPEAVTKYIEELRHDTFLRTYLERQTRDAPYRSVADARTHYSRRLGWYALVRLTKPKVIVETGVDKGLGSVILCAALLRNVEEGSPGHYYGTDIVPSSGWLLKAPYDAVGSLLIGDSIESLKKLDQPVDLFINDSDHSAEYEAQEYECIGPKMADAGIILGDNAHVTSKLATYSRRTGRAFLYFQERPKGHWYPGGGIGISYAQAPPVGGKDREPQAQLVE